MRKIILWVLLTGTLLFNSCCLTDDCHYVDYVSSEYQAIILKREVFEDSVELREPKILIENAGKIYIKDNYIFVNDKYKGFHVYDNTNPEIPEKIKFINIPGATDIAIRNNIIYVNQATDLIAMEYNFSEPKINVIKRIKNIFPNLYSPDGYQVYNLEEDEIVIDWILNN